jgi:hypothetical protein
MSDEHERIERLRDLHLTYVWEVNAAIGEGRDDIVRRLVCDFTDEALRLLTDDSREAGCEREHCPVCDRRRPASA